VHLRSLRIRGFKSFPDTLEIKLEPGVAVIVGPNGSGKSNIADAIVWAAGSLAPSELRAEKPDDVLFAGGGDRKAAEHCEVELVFENEDGTWPDLDFSEVSIARRLVRGAEGQYFVNRGAVRRTDLVEILSDVGLGAAMHSIVGQGKVEQVLASRPEDRRAFVEEAAGLGKFKRRRHRAELKLARVALQVERARDVEEEVRKRLRPLALQATAAERAEKLGLEIAGLRARIAQLDLADSGSRRAEAEERRDSAAFSKRAAQGRLEGLLADRCRAEDELSDAAGRREAAVAGRYRLQGGIERIELRSESATALLERFQAETPATDDPAAQSDVARLELDAARAAGAARAAERERTAVAERAALVRERVRALDQALAEQEGLPPAARALAEDGARLALGALDVAPGSERAVAAALRTRAAAVIADGAAVGLALLQRARAAGLGSLTVLAGSSPQELVGEYPVVPLERLLDVSTPSVTEEGFGYDPARGELWFVGETAEAVLLELQGRRSALAAEAAALEEEVATATVAAEEATERAHAAEALFGRVPRLRAASVDARTLGRLVELAAALRDGIDGARRVAGRFEAPLRARADSGSLRAGELGEELRTLGATEVNLRSELEEASALVTAAEVEIARVDADVADATRRLESAGEVEPAEGDDREELRARVERLDARRGTLGQVNPLAREEYEAEKERLTDLKTQREDLEQSLDELEKLRTELTATVERRFAETFDAVAAHFEDVASTLFPGGEGRLRLVEPENEGDELGIEVELRPAGKRVTRLSLLSGGEKALGAISFLFALFLARPCAFYLLDEVEAALDDTNIARFVELLRRYSDRAQFVVVTHQKRTMEAADILYGVTMGPDGVSQIVSRRLPQHQQPLAQTA
jgi:chromosome segregation protein